MLSRWRQYVAGVVVCAIATPVTAGSLSARERAEFKAAEQAQAQRAARHHIQVRVDKIDVARTDQLAVRCTIKGVVAVRFKGSLRPGQEVEFTHTCLLDVTVTPSARTLDGIDYNRLDKSKHVEVFLNGQREDVEIASGACWVIDGPTYSPLHPPPPASETSHW